jgi:putative inorganic carbon (HCO3(-)) transporter
MGNNLDNIGLARKRFVEYRNIYIFGLAILALICGIAINFANPIIVAASIMILIYLFLLFYYPFIGCLVYVVFEYANVSSMFPALQVLQLGKIIAVPTLGVWYLRMLVSKDVKPVSDKIIHYFLLWLLLAIVSTFFAADSQRAIDGTIDLAKWLIIVLMLVNIVDTLPKWQWLIYVLLLLNLKLSIFQIRTYSSGMASAYDQNFYIREGVGVGTSRFFANAGDFGVAMCVVAPLAFYLFKASRPLLYKLGGLLMTASFVISIVKSGARGNALGLLSIMSIFWLKSKQKFIIGIALVSMVLIYWGTSADIVRERFSTVSSGELDGTSSHRIELWTAGINMLIQNPLLGVGVNNFGIDYANNYAGGDREHAWAPHNLFIQMSSELGFPGIICLGIIIFMLFKRNKETRRLMNQNVIDNIWFNNFATALDLSLIGYMVSGSFLAVLYYPHLFIIMALVISLNQIAKKQALVQPAVYENK